jgi:hypothetical protein
MATARDRHYDTTGRACIVVAGLAPAMHQRDAHPYPSRLSYRIITQALPSLLLLVRQGFSPHHSHLAK